MLNQTTEDAAEPCVFMTLLVTVGAGLMVVGGGVNSGEGIGGGATGIS